MLELAKFAKQHIPEEHELDDQVSIQYCGLNFEHQRNGD